MFYDTATTNGHARICADGTLVAEVLAARTGIQDYAGREVDPDNALGLRDKAVVRVYRSPEEVFSRDSMASFAAAPVTVNHPAEMVDAGNWRRLGVGEIHGDVVRDGERVRVPVIVRDASAVRAAQTTHKQLSMGYQCAIDATPGTTPGGEAFDAQQRDIRINHIALVPAGRGGPDLKITDERPLNLETPMKIKIGDAEVDATNGEAVRVAVDALNLKLATVTTAKDVAETAVATLTTDKATLDAKVATLETQLADAKLTPQALRDAAKAFAVVTDKAKAMGVTVTDAMDENAIMKATVAAKLGDVAKDWSDVQIAASFATLTKDVKATDAAFHNIGLPAPTLDARNEFLDAQAKRRAEMTNAWKQPASAVA